MLSDDVANIIIPLHVITGSDHTSAYHGKKMLEKVITDPEAVSYTHLTLPTNREV